MVRAFEGCLSGNRDSWTPDTEKDTIISLPGHLSGDSFHFKGHSLYMGLEMAAVRFFLSISGIHSHHMNPLAESGNG